MATDRKTIESISNFIFIEDKPRSADIIFIPGGSYAEIGEKAAELYNEGFAPYILPSGKYSIKRWCFSGPLSKADKYKGEYRTEWDFLKDVLFRNGVPESSVLKEDEALFTYDNALKSRVVTDKLRLKINTAIICCKSFHAKRCYMYYKLAFPEAEIIICPSDVQGISKDNWFTIEKGIDKVLGEVTRIGSQFKEYFIEAVKEKVEGDI